MTEAFLKTFEKWLSFRSLSFVILQEQLLDSEAQIYDPAKFVRRTDLKLITHSAACPGGFFYFDNDQLVMLRISSANNDLQTLDPQVLHQYLGEPADQRRSSRSRDHIVYIYPEQGVTFSANDEDISFIEIFPAMSLEEYIEQYYQKPSYKR